MNALDTFAMCLGYILIGAGVAYVVIIILGHAVRLANRYIN